jgi:hypothetical protein
MKSTFWNGLISKHMVYMSMFLLDFDTLTNDLSIYFKEVVNKTIFLFYSFPKYLNRFLHNNRMALFDSVVFYQNNFFLNLTFSPEFDPIMRISNPEMGLNQVL